MDENSENKDWLMEFYRQGSEACRNYSTLTMRTRTTSQQVLVLGVVGIGAAVATVAKETGHQFPLGFTLGGAVFLLFSVSLAIVDWHYQSAFMEIRDALVAIENCLDKDEGIKRVKLRCGEEPGPWHAHLRARTRFRDQLASYVPYFLLFSMGLWLTRKGLNETYGVSYWTYYAIALWLGAAGVVSALVVANTKKIKGKLLKGRAKKP